MALALSCAVLPATAQEEWRIDTTEEWQAAAAHDEGLSFQEGMATPEGDKAFFRSVVKTFDRKRTFDKLTLTQSPEWRNWEPVGRIGPTNLEDAPVFLVRGPGDYWLFGMYRNGQGKVQKSGIQQHDEGFKAESATLAGFDIPLLTTPFPKQYDAPGGMKPGLGGYHAWQSRDMVHWVHHGPVTDGVARWVTTAEQVGDKTYIYYDFPNDQDPHLYIDNDITDGVPGENIGMAFRDPSDGSDCAVIRDLDGKFHLIYEDWSPIDASTHSWDSPLAGHAVSDDGMNDFSILPPSVDQRTTPTGIFKEYAHPHWHAEDPEHFPGKPSAVDVPMHNIKRGGIRAYARYEVHEPEQNAYGDWAAISIGGQPYLFCDFHPAGSSRGKEMSIAWFTTKDINQPFEFCGNMGSGHPDPDIGFAEGKFYLINQTSTDYVSPGPWVETVEARAGADTTGDGAIDTWTAWREVKESYDHIEGFSKQIQRTPAELDLSGLPAAVGFGFELRIKDTTANPSTPILDSVVISFP